MENDLYNILELNQDATLIDIKKNFKRLALKYHPDKNKNKNSNININYNEKFNQIRIAYEILSNIDKKSKYDKMNKNKKQNFIDTLFQFLRKITDPHIIQNIMLRPDIMNDIKDGDINIIAQNLIHRILDNIDLNIDIKELEEVFIHTPNKNTTETNILSTFDYNTLNIIGSVNVNIDDVYHNRIKEITIRRKVYKNNIIIDNDTLKYNIPLYDNKITIDKAGDKIIDDTTITDIGNAIIKLKYMCPPHITKDNYNIIYNDSITMYELFYGFDKQINYFNTIIDISTDNPLKEHSFNGDYISINIKNKGLPYNLDNNRGNLIINLYLLKDDNFKYKLQLF